MQNDEDTDGCALDFDDHPTKATEVEDYLIPAGEEEDEDDD